MNWYLQSGSNSEIVMSSRIALSRNIKGIPFVPKCTKEHLKKVCELMKDVSLSIGYGLKFVALKDLDTTNRQTLVDKNILSEEFAYNKGEGRAILINDDENICIEVNNRDHIRIKVFGAGNELENLLNLAMEIDKKLDDYVPISYHDQYGYLTTSPTDIGTGLKASVLVHLPILTKTNNIRKISSVINNLGMNIKGVYIQKSSVVGDIYEIKTKQSLGVNEVEIIKGLNVLVQKVVDQEKNVRNLVIEKNQIEFEDELCRNYGVLVNARKIDNYEVLDLLSSTKLAVDLGIIDELNDKKIMQLYVYTKPGMMDIKLGKKINAKDRPIERAKLIKEIVKEK